MSESVEDATPLGINSIGVNNPNALRRAAPMNAEFMAALDGLR